MSDPDQNVTLRAALGVRGVRPTDGLDVRVSTAAPEYGWSLARPRAHRPARYHAVVRVATIVTPTREASAVRFRCGQIQGDPFDLGDDPPDERLPCPRCAVEVSRVPTTPRSALDACTFDETP